MASLDRVTRRRLVLGLLLAASLVLLSGWYRESQTGPLHGGQRVAASVAAPLETAMQRVARPFRDGFGWARGLVDARAERDQLKRQVAQLKLALAQVQTGQDRTSDLRRLLNFVNDPRTQSRLAGYTYKGADVIARAPGIYATKVTINAGSCNGLSVLDPAITGEGWLVGQLTSVSCHTSQVTLLNDPSSAVGAKIPGAGAAGYISASVGDPNTLSLGYVRIWRPVKLYQLVTTSGWSRQDPNLRSNYPPGLPLGQVTNVGQSESDLFKQIQVTPLADLSSFSSVLVLRPKNPVRRP